MRRRHGRSKYVTALLCLLFSLITIYEGVHFEDWNHRAAARLVMPTVAPVTLRPATKETGEAFTEALQASQAETVPENANSRVAPSAAANAATPASTADPSYALQPQSAAWVITESANVHADASADAAVIEKLAFGSELSVMDAPEQNGWYKVRTASGRTGYVSGEFLTAAKPSDQNSGSSENRQYAQTVYISRSGECYHSRADCSGIRTPTALTEDEAIARGRRRCTKCW